MINYDDFTAKKISFKLSTLWSEKLINLESEV